ncbi:hypothetical protein V2J09_004922 [Rumex salicifolius]
MDLEFEKYCKVDKSPITILPSPRHAKLPESRKGSSVSRNDKESLEAGFREIKLRNYHRSVSCKSLQARNNELSVDSKVLKRGCSVYQSSKERKPLRRLESVWERKKIEVSLGDSPFSFSLLDSICGSDDEEEEKPLENRSVESSKESSCVALDLMENPKFKFHQVVGPSNNANILHENDQKALHYSLSAKLAFSDSPVHLDSYGSNGSPKSRFTSIRKMFEPLTKSKSHRSPLSSKLESGDIISSDQIVSEKSKTPQKSPSSDLKATATTCAGAQLHGDLRLEHKHGVLYFELSLAHSEEIFVAKTWKAEDTLNWVYTFHSLKGRKKSNAIGSGMKYSNKVSPIIGQMQVSCHLLSELKECGAFSDSMFEKYCKVDKSPITILPSPRHAKLPESRKGSSVSRNDKESLEAGFREIKLRNYHRSVSCKSLQARNNELSVDSKVLKRGCSVYQSSKERKPLRRLESVWERKKIEVSLGDSPFSFSLLDSICGSDDEEEEKPLENRSVESSKESSCVALDLMENPKFKFHQVVGPSNNANILHENDQKALHYSLSAKLAFSDSPVHLDSYGSNGSPKSRFTSIRKMFEPLTKSKSHRSPLSSKLESGDIISSDQIVSEKSKTPQKSPSSDLKATATTCAGAQLHGDLRLEHKHGVLYFELSLAHSEEIFVAKTWKAEDTLNWVYTFHSLKGRKKSNAIGSGMKYSNKVSPIIGQMQVSCHLLSELKECGAFSDSMVTEFVLYDIMQRRKSFAPEEFGSVSDDYEALNACKRLDDRFDSGLLQSKATNALEKSSSDYSSPYPWAPTDLHPSLETAAFVIQVPFKKRESLKYSSDDKFSHQVQLNLLDLSQKIPREVTDRTGTSVSVVTPMGSHSLPNCESRGPLPLLDRWRLGGGCDCGGWDMACPVVVFSNHSTELKEEYPFLKQDRPFELCVQGAKEKTPALTIQFSGKGKYAVDFQPQLSTLQAFGICVAMLHATEASARAEQEKNTQCNTLKDLFKDEVKILIDSVTEERVKEKVRRTVENHPSSFKPNPPFSPISRV